MTFQTPHVDDLARPALPIGLGELSADPEDIKRRIAEGPPVSAEDYLLRVRSMTFTVQTRQYDIRVFVIQIRSFFDAWRFSGQCIWYSETEDQR